MRFLNRTKFYVKFALYLKRDQYYVNKFYKGRSINMTEAMQTD